MLNFVNRTRSVPTDSQRQMVLRGQTMPDILHQLDTSKLVELLQQSALEQLTAFRQLEAQEFRTETVATDFDALYAYKRGEYQRCLRLSTYNVRTLIGVGGKSAIFAWPEFIQLMDDEIVSLIGLTLIVDPWYRDYIFDVLFAQIHQLYLSLYLMTQCQIKLHHPVTSLAQTLDYVEVARRHLDERFTLDQLLFKLIERKILIYVYSNTDLI